MPIQRLAVIVLAVGGPDSGLKNLKVSQIQGPCMILHYAKCIAREKADPDRRHK